MTLWPASTRGRRRVARRCRWDGGVAEAHLVELGPLQEEVQVVLPREPDAAVHLERRRHHPLRRVGAPDLGRGRRDGRVGIVADAPRRPVGGRAHALDVDEHVGAAVLHRLEAPDRPPELDPVLGVLDGQVEGAGRAPEHLGRGEGRAPVEQRVDGVRTAEAHRRRRVEIEPTELAGEVHRRFPGGATHRVEVDGEERVAVAVPGDDHRDRGRRRPRHGSGTPGEVVAGGLELPPPRRGPPRAPDLAPREPVHELVLTRRAARRRARARSRGTARARRAGRPPRAAPRPRRS